MPESITPTFSCPRIRCRLIAWWRSGATQVEKGLVCAVVAVWTAFVFWITTDRWGLMTATATTATAAATIALARATIGTVDWRVRRVTDTFTDVLATRSKLWAGLSRARDEYLLGIKGLDAQEDATMLAHPLNTSGFRTLYSDLELLTSQFNDIVDLPNDTPAWKQVLKFYAGVLLIQQRMTVLKGVLDRHESAKAWIELSSELGDALFDAGAYETVDSLLSQINTAYAAMRHLIEHPHLI